MTDQEILQQLLEQLKNDISIEQSMKKVYTYLVTKFPEDGFQIEMPDMHLHEDEENSLRELAKLGYLKLRYGHCAYGWCYTIDLRGHRFHVLKNPDWDIESKFTTQNSIPRVHLNKDEPLD
jgi:hypothetical protein